MNGPFIIVCRAHSGGRVLAEAFIRNGIQLGNVRQDTKDTYFFAIRKNDTIKDLVNISFEYDHLSLGEKLRWGQKLENCVSKFIENEIIKKVKPFGWKFGETLFLTPVILDTFSNARVIHIVRDGRDVMLSRIQSRFDTKIHEPFNKMIIFGKQNVDEFLGEPFNEETINKFRNELEIQHWVTCMNFGLKCRRYQDRYLEIKYENLCKSPITTLSQVFNFLNLDFQPECRQWAISKISDNRIGKWKNLTIEELKLPLEIGSECLKKLGYL